jgi:hypothetical protein
MSKRKTAALLALLAGTLALSGCGDGNNDYACKMPGACAPVRMTYNNARQNTYWSGWSVDGAYDAHRHKKEKPPVLAAPGGLSPSADVGTMEHPVYHPATPYMVWLAPYVTRNNHMHSSSLEWFTVPGYWEGPDGVRMTATDKRGARGNFAGWHPLLPGDIGFHSLGAAVASGHNGGVLSNIVQPK